MDFKDVINKRYSVRGPWTCYIGAFKEDKARKFLKLPDEYEVVLFTPIGYGNAEPRDTPRKPIEDLVEFI